MAVPLPPCWLRQDNHSETLQAAIWQLQSDCIPSGLLLQSKPRQRASSSISASSNPPHHQHHCHTKPLSNMTNIVHDLSQWLSGCATHLQSSSSQLLISLTSQPTWPRVHTPYTPLLAAVTLGQGAPQQPKAKTREFPPPAPCPFKPGDVVDGRYRLVRRAGDWRFSWLWLAQPLSPTPTSSGAVQTAPHGSTTSQPPVIIKMSMYTDPEHHTTARHERDMTACVQSEPKARATELLPDTCTSTLDMAPVVPLLDSFDIPSVDGGCHACMVLKMLGDSLEVVTARYGRGLLAALSAQAGQSVTGDLSSNLGLPLPVVKRLTRRILQAVDHVHRRGVIHNAIYPEHIMLAGPFAPLGSELASSHTTRHASIQDKLSTLVHRQWPTLACRLGVPLPLDHSLPIITEESLPRAPLALLDFGNAWPVVTSSDALAQTVLGDQGLWNFRSNPGFRPPEDLLGYGNRTSASDMWQVAMTVWLLATGDCLFDNTPLPPGIHQDKLNEHLEAIIRHLGPFPKQVLNRSVMGPVFFHRSGRLRCQPKHTPIAHYSLSAVLEREYRWDTRQARALEAFLVPLFSLDPDQRPTAGQALDSPWLGRSSCHAADADSDDSEYDSEVAEAVLHNVLGPHNKP